MPDRVESEFPDLFRSDDVLKTVMTGTVSSGYENILSCNIWHMVSY
ncbi:Uncharacterized protein dnm_056370 [Desulfonema magnum]|uniref:Uncharacterized protein n=1 Tax=Desulfonema magnum TaxID=45655 RepID=A0A975BQ11_9BACT|nr:Uncharacterized protein dnm_056370 [Desulfonema magnum]